ncbi:Tn3 family transposase [Microtetraspora malaysiensis]|uniref:Tn3 family transposase n=1 Tax=Microtetraspora malaysiensis TaxID=161358 RepID=UPI003D8BF176
MALAERGEHDLEERKRGVPALERSPLSHVFQSYFRPETLAVANAPLVARQAGLSLAQAWGGGWPRHPRSQSSPASWARLVTLSLGKAR